MINNIKIALRLIYYNLKIRSKIFKFKKKVLKIIKKIHYKKN